jgi:hypothetical protein
VARPRITRTCVPEVLRAVARGTRAHQQSWEPPGSSCCSSLLAGGFWQATEGCRGKPPSTLLRAGGNPRTIWSGQQRCVNGASLLEGGAWLWALRNALVVVEKLEGAVIASRRCFVDSPLLSFLFLLGMFLLLPQHFSCFELLYRCGCYINIAGQKPVSRRFPESFISTRMKMTKRTIRID